jgi:hypothetical protein
MIEGRMAEPSFHPVLRSAAKFVSVVFHPLFIPVYIGWFFVYVLRLFPEQDEWHKTLLLIQFLVNYTILPLVTLLLAKGLGFIDSIYLKTQKDRIIPYIATGIFYFWVWYVFRNQKFPDALVMFSLAVFLASSIGLILNIYFKVSMHALSMGIMLTLMMILAFHSSGNFGFYLACSFLVAGLVCTARLMNSDHSGFEVYAGLFVGIICQLIAWWVI